MEKIMVRKLNVYKIVSEDQLKHYLDNGFVRVTEPQHEPKPKQRKPKEEQ